MLGEVGNPDSALSWPIFAVEIHPPGIGTHLTP